MRFRALAPGKVNLCLFLGGTRADSRHELVTLFESVSLADELEVTALGAGSDEVICPGVPEPNLVTTALQALRDHGWSAPPLRVQVHKRLPVSAGMGGGSADAAALLRLAPRLAPIADEILAELAARLGADVPSQLEPGLVLGMGAGEIVQRVAPLAEHALLILPQSLPLATAAVYREADRLALARPADELRTLREELNAVLAPDAELPSRLLVNDLEPAAVSLCPVVATALKLARGCGADHALVCGSGPTVAGLYWGGQGLARARAAVSGLRDRFPGAEAVIPAAGSVANPQPVA